MEPTPHAYEVADIQDDYQERMNRINELVAPYHLRADRLWVAGDIYGLQFWYEPIETYGKYFCAGRAASPDLLLDAMEQTIRTLMEADAMNIFSTDLFEYMTGEMIGDKSVTLTISEVELQDVTSNRGTESKPIVTFVERDKKWVLNKTNARFLAEAMGPETTEWHGRQIKLIAPMISAFGKNMRAVRVERVLPVKKGKNNGKPVAIEELPFDEDTA